jgi:hypothetical protein
MLRANVPPGWAAKKTRRHMAPRAQEAGIRSRPNFYLAGEGGVAVLDELDVVLVEVAGAVVGL